MQNSLKHIFYRFFCAVLKDILKDSFWTVDFFCRSHLMQPHIECQALPSPLLLYDQFHSTLAHHSGQFHHKMFTLLFFWVCHIQILWPSINSGNSFFPFKREFFSEIWLTQKSLEMTSVCLFCVLTYYSNIFWSSPSLGFPIHNLGSRQGSQASI